MRDLITIGADIDAAQKWLEDLLRERADFLSNRRQNVIKAFDDGATRAELCEAFGLDKGTIALFRAGRNERQRRGAQLPVEKRPHYDRLLRQGLPSRTAAQIAESLS